MEGLDEIVCHKRYFNNAKGSTKPTLECTHEEADIREIWRVGTDIGVLLMGKFVDMQVKYPQIDKLVAFGVR